MSQRIERVQELVRAEVSDIVRTRVRDPRVGMVTFTETVVSKDLRHARIFFSVYGDAEAAEKCRLGLESAGGFIRGELGKRLSLRYIPELTFTPDPAMERASRLEELLNQIGAENSGTLPESPPAAEEASTQ